MFIEFTKYLLINFSLKLRLAKLTVKMKILLIILTALSTANSLNDYCGTEYRLCGKENHIGCEQNVTENIFKNFFKFSNRFFLQNFKFSYLKIWKNYRI